jgi:sec-independent protein translocase protein TatA
MSMFVTMGAFGWPQIALIAVLFLLLFGAKKIPDMMKGVGRGVKEFKDAVNKDYSADDTKTEDKKKLEE